MNFEFSEEEKQFQKEVSNYAKQQLPPDWDERALLWPGGWGTNPQFERNFQDVFRPLHKSFGKKGWLTLGWPKEYGGMNSMIRQAIVDDIMSYYRIPLLGAGTLIVGPAMIHFGDEEMKKRWLPMISRGEVTFWLGYSEPDAGSDLGAIRTTATPDGDDYLINGQKTWSSGAQVFDYGFVIARTDPSSKYKGLTVFIVPSNSPGITIDAIENICGIHSFNNVFLDNVRVPRRNIVGEINNAFPQLMTMLSWERTAAYVGGFRRLLEELIDYVRETTVNEVPLSRNPFVRNKLSALAIEIEALYAIYWRVAWLRDQGRLSELEASGFKLFNTELSRKAAYTAMEILGPWGQLEMGSKWAPLRGRVAIGYLDCVSGPIGAGTSEIQRNIIAGRGLGLPRQ